MKKQIIYIIILAIFYLPTIKYIHAKTLGIGSTDCEIIYIQKYYPFGSKYYKILSRENHIDTNGMEYEGTEVNGVKYEGMEYKGSVYGCNMGDVFNSIYCVQTLVIETYLMPKK